MSFRLLVISVSSISCGAIENAVITTSASAALGLCGRGRTRSLELSVTIRPSVVVRRSTSSVRGVTSDSTTRPSLLVRHLRPGLRGPFVRPICFGPVVSRGEASFHQRPGTPGDQTRPAQISTSYRGSHSWDICGQHYGLSLCKETGRDDLRVPEFRSSDSPPLVRVPQCHPSTSACDGVTQCSRGFVKPQEPSHRVQMDVGSRVSGRASPTMAGDYRSVRDLSELSDPCLFLANQRSDGGGDGRFSSIMGRSLGLCVSSFCSDQGGHQETPVVSQHLFDSDRSMVASKGVVPGSSGVSIGTSSHSSSRPFTSTAFSSVSSSAPRATASRVETVDRFAREVGVSRQVAHQLAQCHHASSQCLYQHRWKCYRQWCASKGHTVSTPSVTKIADFLFFLRKKKGLSISSIKGFHSMLSSVFKFQLPDIQDSFIIKDLLRSFELERPPRSPNLPSCDLVKVLAFLRDARFEPLSSCDFHSLTMKVLFLLSLATAKRVGELMLCPGGLHFRGKIYLSYLPEFVAKTESERNPLPRFFIVKSLEDFVGDLPEDHLLCPARAVRIYLECTASIVPRPRALFVSRVVRLSHCLRMLRRFSYVRLLKIRGLWLMVLLHGLTVFEVLQPLLYFCGTGRSPRCLRRQLGDQIQSLLLFIYTTFLLR